MTPEQVQAWIEECKAKLAEAADPDNHRRP